MFPLLTPRLTIRAFTDADAAAYRALSAACFDAHMSDQAARDWITWTALSQRFHDQLHQPPYGDYAICLGETGALIGAVGLAPSVVPWAVLLPDGDRSDLRVSPEFGLFWAIHPDHQNRGYATEAARALIDWFWKAWSPRRIVATTEFDNAASQGVMRALGMTLYRNPTGQPFWCEVVGVLERPAS